MSEKELTWAELNNKLRAAKTEKAVLALMEEERSKPSPRIRFVRRIHSRFVKLRNSRERKELMKDKGSYKGPRMPEGSEQKEYA